MNKFFTKKKIIKLSKKLLKLNLQFLNFGNLSIRVGNLCFIKPSGVNIYKIKYNDVSVVDIKTNKHLSGKKPSVDTPTHLELYKKYPLIKSIVHTHSKYGTIWAQSLKPVPCYGTTHADFFLKNIPITKVLTKKQISNNYKIDFVMTSRKCAYLWE